MDQRTEQNRGAGPVRAGLEIDAAALDAWLAVNVAGYAGPLTVEQFRGGQSNPTYRLTTPAASYVLRRKPPGTLLPGAHAVDREYRVLAALGPTDVPVPRVHTLCLDAAVIGTPFYVMDLVEGRIVWDVRFPDVTRAARAAHFDAMNAAIAALHRVDPAAVGLSDYGKAENYLGRQVARWTRQYEADAPLAGRDADMERLIAWLPAHLPADAPAAICHGDFRCDNMIFAADRPRIDAILDWELSTLGHPLADFAYHALMYRVPPTLLVGLVGEDLAALGIPAEADYVAAYGRRLGRAMPDLGFFYAFGLFRLAGILHGIKARIARGTASSPHARQAAAKLEATTALAWAEAQRA